NRRCMNPASAEGVGAGLPAICRAPAVKPVLAVHQVNEDDGLWRLSARIKNRRCMNPASAEGVGAGLPAICRHRQ
ncbi:hypothetical protein ABQX22_13320, partial [Xanthomonas sp. WHRI 1810A]|uniref:hypothetical protein n=1 Tax=Xanthomonas sp. WHRI 1810A TaxID=3161565 RepID=UPI0032E88D40